MISHLLARFPELTPYPVLPMSAFARPVNKPLLVKCPQCGTEVVWSAESPYRPFCSDRCRLIDLGAWESESYRVPVVEEPEDIEGGLDEGED